MASIETQANLSGGVSDMKNSMLKEFGHFDPRLIQLISCVAMPICAIYLADVSCSQSSHVKCWPLKYYDPLVRWSNGRVILIGDAAHPVCRLLTVL